MVLDANIGLELLVLGLVLWIMGAVAAAQVKELAPLAPIGKLLFFVGIVLFVVLLFV